MTELWEILLPPEKGWPASVEHVGSVYMPHESTPNDVAKAAVKRFGSAALAYRRSTPRADYPWKWIES